MCTTTDSGRLGSKASFVIRSTSERFSSKLCEPDSDLFHFRMKLVVGTMTILPAYVLNAYLPGSSGISQTPRSPCSTSSPWPYVSPERSAPVSPVYDTTTPTVPDLDDRLRHVFDRGEEPVEVVGAFDEDLQLAAATATGGQKPLGILEVVVIGGGVRRVVPDGRRDDLAGVERGPVVDRHDAEDVVMAGQHDRLEAVAVGDQVRHPVEQRAVAVLEGEPVHVALGDHHELGEVDRVRAFAQDPPLRAALAALREEGGHVAVVGTGREAAERLGGRQRLAVTGEDVADLALRDRHQRDAVDPVLERSKEVEPTAQDVRLETGLTAQCDQPVGHRAARAPQLLDDAHAMVGDVSDRSRRPHHEQGGEGNADSHKRGRDKRNNLLDRRHTTRSLA